MNLLQFKALFILVTAVIALLVASPVLQRTLVYPQTEFFTELSLLGSGHSAEDYPYNVSSGFINTVFLGITNNLGSCSYYQVQVKFRNESQSAPDSFNRTYSSQPSLYNVEALVANNENWELPILFGLEYYKVDEDTVALQSFYFNGAIIKLNQEYSEWNSTKNVFYGNLILELWVYNVAQSSFQYHERFVDLKLNMTVAETIIS